MRKFTQITAFALSFALMFNSVALAAGKAMPRGDEYHHEVWDERNKKIEHQDKEKKEREKEREEKRKAPKVYEGSFGERLEQKNKRREKFENDRDVIPLEESTDVTEEITPYDLDTKLGFYSLGKSYPKVDENENVALMSTTGDDYAGLTRPEYINNIYAPKILDNSGDVSVSPYSGEVQVNVTDLVLPGRNGLDLTLSHFYQSSHAEVEYGNEENDYMVKPTTYYNERYALGIGWSFGFPSVEIRDSEDGLTQEIYYHDGKGGSYRYNGDDELVDIESDGTPVYNGHQIYCTNLDNYYTDNVIFSVKDHSYRRGSYRSQYSFKTADNTMQYFGKTGELIAIVDRYGNEITFDHENYPGRNLIDFGSAYGFRNVSGYWTIKDKGVIFDSSSRSTKSVRSQAIPIDELYSDYRISFIYEAPDPKKPFKDPFEGTFKVSYMVCSGTTVLDTVLVEEGITPEKSEVMYTFQADIQLEDLRDYDETPDNIKLLIEVVNGKSELQLWNFRVSPMRPLISKITDTVGRTLEFDYEGDIYLEYEDNNFPLTVTVKDPDGNVYRTIDYYRTLYTYEWDLFDDDKDETLLKSHEHRFFMFTGSDNGEQNVEPIYGKGFKGYYRTDGFTYKVGHGYYFYERPLVIGMNFDYYKTFMEFEKTQKRIGDGFTDTWRVIQKYDVDMYGSEEETATDESGELPSEANVETQSETTEEVIEYNCTSYYYESGRFHDETAFNMREATSYIDPDYGKYIVEVTGSDGAIHSYAYTMHTFERGKRLVRRIMLPLLDQEVICESDAAGADTTDVTYTYDEKQFYAINMPNSTTTVETVDGVTRTYVNNYEYDDDSCMVYKSTLNLTEAEAKKDDFPDKKTEIVEYKKLSNRLFLPEKQTYYQSEDGDLLAVSIEYDSAGRRISETNENGETVYYEYDTVFTWLPTRVYYKDPMKIGDEDRVAEILYEYADEYGFGPTATKVKYADGEYAVTYAQYEPKYGNVVRTIDENGNETEYTYDEFGRVEYTYSPSYLSESGEMYLVRSYNYDFKPSARVITYRAGTSRDKYAQITEENCVEDVSYKYNGFGNLVEKYDGIDNSSEKNIYDLSNRLVGYQNVVDYDTDVYTMSYTYDGLDRIVSATDKIGNTQSVDYKSLSKEFSFTPAGATAAENHYVENYDIYGNLIKTTTYPEGLDDAESAIMQTYEYDLVGNLLTTTDGNGKITSYEYDNIGNPVLVVTPDGKRIETKFSKFGTPAEVTLYNGDESCTIAKTYDDRGLETSTEQKGLDVYTRPWYYEYADDGNITVITEPNGNKKLYTYDNSFNVIGLDIGSENRTYAYNHLGLVDRVTSTVNGVAAQTVDYDYGYKGELYEKTVNGETISYDYNELYNLTSVTTPSGHVREYTRDDLQRVTTITADNKEFKYVYNGDGLVKEVIYPTSDIVTSYTYDNANQITSVVTKKGEEVLASYEYEYDKAGNITEISGSENVTYTYDDLYRLSSYTKDGVTVSYEYDGRSNIIAEESSDGNLVTYTYSGDNRLESKTENGVEVTYEYDLNGNLISDSMGNRYSYDENNKLVYAKVDGEEVRYTIGLDGLRTSKTTDEGTVEYFVDENGLVVSENSDQIIWGNRALAKKIGSNYYYYIYNVHGDVVMMLDESGNIVNSYSYDPWGVVTSEVETVDNSIKYAGEYHDEETGLIYLRARYYDPSIGRFTQEDPARDDWNWYSYCGNNPIMFVDPSGKAYEWIENSAARFSLLGIAFDQYKWMIAGEIVPGLAQCINVRIQYSIRCVENYKDTINAVAEAYGVRADIIGGVIFKEQLTQSLPDNLALLDTSFNPERTHSVGLAAINPGLARSAWKYVNTTVYESLPSDDASLQKILTDPDFNIQTLAASLIYIAGCFHNISAEQLGNLTDEQWKWILNDYNCGNSYNEKVMEYLPDIRELLD